MAVAALHGFFQIAGVENVFHLLGIVGPDAGEEIGLQLESDGKLVGFLFHWRGGGRHRFCR